MANNRFGRERRSEGGRRFNKDDKGSGRRFKSDSEGGRRFSRDSKGSTFNSDSKGGRRFSKFDKDHDRVQSRNSDDRVKIEFTDIICDKCGKRSKVPFKPSENKPVYCRDCFQKPGDMKNKDLSSNLNQFGQINQKLDKIMEALNLK